MSKVLITRSKLDGLATTIAAKSGATLPLTIAQMDAAVDGIVVGSGTDTSHDTVDAAHLLDGYTAHDSTGTAITGTYVPPTFTTQAKTATPTTSQQIVTPDSGYDGLSSVTVNAIPSEYVVPSGTKSITENGTGIDVTAYASVDVAVPTFDALSWLGEGAELVATYAEESTLLSSTTYASWTPSTTAKTIKSEASAGTYTVDMANYDYLIRWQYYCEPAYNGSQTNTARFVKTVQEIYQGVFRRPSTLANIASLNDSANVCQTVNTPSLMEYYNKSSSHTFTWAASYGIYAAAAAATFASSTSTSTTMTVKRPAISARCSTTYFSTSNAGKVDQSQTYFRTKGYLYRIKKSKSLGYNECHSVCSLFNDGM